MPITINKKPPVKEVLTETQGSLFDAIESQLASEELEMEVVEAPSPTPKAEKKSKKKAKALTQEVVAAEVQIKHADGSVVSKKEEVGVVLEDGPMANVGVQASRTINIGDYNNIKIGVSLHLPAKPDPESIEEAFQFCLSFVDGHMAKLITDYTES